MHNQEIRLDKLTQTLSIYQAPGAFCFGTDAVLLAWFCRRKKAEKPIDLCTGNGVIPLLLSEGKYSEIYGLELLETQAALARQSVRYNELSDRIRILHGDLRKIGKDHTGDFTPLTNGAFDLVTVNPPYDPSGRGKQAEGDRGIARCEKECTLRDAVRAASYLLRHGGRLCMIHRAERTAEIFSAMREETIEPKVLLPVVSKPGKGVSLVLTEGKKGAEPGLIFEEALVIQNADGSYTQKAKEIYKDFEK